MTEVSRVPQSQNLDGTDLGATMRPQNVGQLGVDALVRFRETDGLSFARAMAFQTVLAIVPGTIGFMALAAWLGEGTFQSVLRDTITTLAPGPAGEFFTSAFRQGSETDGANHILVMILSIGAALWSAIPAMAQFQRGASRIYGVAEDRPTVKRYLRAVVLTLSVGAAMAVAFVSIVVGSALGGENAFTSTWLWLRWPLGIAVLAAALAVLYKFAPNRRQPPIAWLLLGGAVGVVTWLLLSAGLSLYLTASSTFGDVYGPLAGFIGVMIWALLSSVGIFFGLAVAAQLEAEHAHDSRKAA